MARSPNSVPAPTESGRSACCRAARRAYPRPDRLATFGLRREADTPAQFRLRQFVPGFGLPCPRSARPAADESPASTSTLCFHCQVATRARRTSVGERHFRPAAVPPAPTRTLPPSIRQATTSLDGPPMPSGRSAAAWRHGRCRPARYPTTAVGATRCHWIACSRAITDQEVTSCGRSSHHAFESRLAQLPSASCRLISFCASSLRQLCLWPRTSVKLSSP